MIKATVLADSVNTDTGNRITTLSLTYPRFIHSEFMTHRVFSRNAMSSRAVPVRKMIDQVRYNPVMPLHIGANKPGMQAGEELQGAEREQALNIWRNASIDMASHAEALDMLGVHKQITNRLLEPFQWMHTVVTSTEWSNFFALRTDPAAEPHIQMLAVEMQKAMKASTPIVRNLHVPYTDHSDAETCTEDELMLVSAARCARVSYNNHDGSAPDKTKDLDLAMRLASQRHMSPFEHTACAAADDAMYANLRGWVSLRFTMEY